MYAEMTARSRLAAASGKLAPRGGLELPAPEEGDMADPDEWDQESGQLGA